MQTNKHRKQVFWELIDYNKMPLALLVSTTSNVFSSMVKSMPVGEPNRKLKCPSLIARGYSLDQNRNSYRRIIVSYIENDMLF